MKIQKIIPIYLVALGLLTLLNLQFPAAISVFVNFIFPSKFDLTSQDFIRYRMAMFIVGSGTFLVLIPIVFMRGIFGMTFENIKRMHWLPIVIAAMVIPIIWIGYPFISLCPTCWTANDIFYFFLTIGFFVSMQMSAQAVLVKIFQHLDWAGG